MVGADKIIVEDLFKPVQRLSHEFLLIILMVHFYQKSFRSVI